MNPADLANEIKTHRELYGKDPEVGYEWDAGNTPPGDKSPGRWTVKGPTENTGLVLFHSFLTAGAEYTIQTFPPTETAREPLRAWLESWWT